MIKTTLVINKPRMDKVGEFIALLNKHLVEVDGEWVLDVLDSHDVFCSFFGIDIEPGEIITKMDACKAISGFTFRSGEMLTIPVSGITLRTLLFRLSNMLFPIPGGLGSEYKPDAREIILDVNELDNYSTITCDDLKSKPEVGKGILNPNEIDYHSIFSYKTVKFKPINTTECNINHIFDAPNKAALEDVKGLTTSATPQVNNVHIHTDLGLEVGPVQYLDKGMEKLHRLGVPKLLLDALQTTRLIDLSMDVKTSKGPNTHEIYESCWLNIFSWVKFYNLKICGPRKIYLSDLNAALELAVYYHHRNDYELTPDQAVHYVNEFSLYTNIYMARAARMCNKQDYHDGYLTWEEVQEVAKDIVARRYEALKNIKITAVKPSNGLTLS